MQELNLGYDCHWRYHNYSVLNYDPHPSGEFLSFHFALTSLSLCPVNLVDKQLYLSFYYSPAENRRLLLLFLERTKRRFIILGWSGHIDV